MGQDPGGLFGRSRHPAGGLPLRYATANLIAAQRRELALLRARRATPKQVVALSIAISTVIALIGVFLGIGVGLVSSAWLAQPALHGGLLAAGNVSLLLKSAGVALIAGLLFALVAIILPTRSLYLAEVQAGRRQIEIETQPPLWQRLS
ncbi:MAG: ABC transporter permease [Caldilineaceae bacterium]